MEVAGFVRSELHRAEVKLSARRHLLQLSAGMFDVFELRLQHVPYRLGWLCYDDISFETKADIVREFRSVNEDSCRPCADGSECSSRLPTACCTVHLL